MHTTAQMMTDPPTILIVDDDAAVRRLIATILRADAYEFREAADVADAIAALTEAPQLIVLDINVPGDGGGLAVLAHVRSTEALAAVRVLLVSGVAEAYEDGWGVGLGADGHLAKPFEIDGLRGAVRELLR